MKNKTAAFILMAGALTLCGALTAQAITYDDTITAIFGSGNPNTGWTSDSGDNGLVLALRGKDYTTGSTANTLGVYSFAVGYAAGHGPGDSKPRAGWNYEFSVNGGSSGFSAYDFYLGMDTDLSQGIHYAFGLVDPLSYFGDNAVSGGVSQNSENIIFGNSGGLDPTLDATLDYELFAVLHGDGPMGARQASTHITVVAGAGGASVPDGGATASLMLLGVGGLGLAHRKFAFKSLIKGR